MIFEAIRRSNGSAIHQTLTPLSQPGVISSAQYALKDPLRQLQNFADAGMVNGKLCHSLSSSNGSCRPSKRSPRSLSWKATTLTTKARKARQQKRSDASDINVIELLFSPKKQPKTEVIWINSRPRGSNLGGKVICRGGCRRRGLG